jgi:uncharacterized protein YnzC (UPF0291/DUF896 family)
VIDAAKILVSAFKGNIETVAVLAKKTKTAGYAQDELDETGETLVVSVQSVAQQAIASLNKLLEDKKVKGLKMQPAGLVAMAAKTPKQIA